MRKLYENFHISHFQKRIYSAEMTRRNTVFKKTEIFRKMNAEGKFIQQNQSAISALSAFCNFPIMHDIQLLRPTY